MLVEIPNLIKEYTMARPQSIFSSTKLFVENSVGVTVDAVTLVRAELQHTSRLNALENEAEYEDTVVSQVIEITNQLETLDKTKDKFLIGVLTKRLERLKTLI